MGQMEQFYTRPFKAGVWRGLQNQHVSVAERADLGPLQSGIGGGGEPSNKPGVPDGEGQNADLHPKQAGAKRPLQNSGCCWMAVSLRGGRIVLGRTASSCSRPNPISGCLADNRLHKGKQGVVDFKRPYGISGTVPSAFQLTRLIQVMNIYITAESWMTHWKIFDVRAATFPQRTCVGTGAQQGCGWVFPQLPSLCDYTLARNDCLFCDFPSLWLQRAWTRALGPLAKAISKAQICKFSEKSFNLS